MQPSRRVFLSQTSTLSNVSDLEHGLLDVIAHSHLYGTCHYLNQPTEKKICQQSFVWKICLPNLLGSLSRCRDRSLSAGRGLFLTGEHCHTQARPPGSKREQFGLVLERKSLGAGPRERRKEEAAKALSHQRAGKPPRPWTLVVLLLKPAAGVGVRGCAVSPGTLRESSPVPWWVCREQTGALEPHWLPGCLQDHPPWGCVAQERDMAGPCPSWTQGSPLHTALNLPHPGFLYL